ncbi:hypothetical protein P4S64_19035 [Vibrio sp. M60_M31a]
MKLSHQVPMLPGIPRMKNIYTSREVGATSSTSGIELEGAVNSITPVQVNVENDTVGVVTDVDGRCLLSIGLLSGEKDDIINITPAHWVQGR